jgi:hypothetical protein
MTEASKSEINLKKDIQKDHPCKTLALFEENWPQIN